MKALTTRLFIIFQYLAPQHLLSRLAGSVADCEIVLIKNTLIKYFIKYFNVNMEEAAESNYENYKSFNAFFTRALREDARPVVDGPTIISPADGAISQLGKIKQTLNSKL